MAAPLTEFSAQEFAQSLLWSQLDTLQQELKTQGQLQSHIAGAATVVTAALSTGYVFWVLRGSFLLASFLSTVPTWQSLDPLPIVDGDRNWDSNDDDDESLADIAQSHSRDDSASSAAPSSASATGKSDHP